MSMEQLGREFDIVHVAAGQSVALKQAAGVTFSVAASAAAVITVNSQTAAGGAATACAAVKRVYTRTAQNGTAAWTTAGDQAPASTVNVATGAQAAFYVDAADLPAGAQYVEAVVTSGTATVVAVLGNLLQAEDPTRLIVPGV